MVFKEHLKKLVENQVRGSSLGGYPVFYSAKSEESGVGWRSKMGGLGIVAKNVGNP